MPRLFVSWLGSRSLIRTMQPSQIFLLPTKIEVNEIFLNVIQYFVLLSLILGKDSLISFPAHFRSKRLPCKKCIEGKLAKKIRKF